MRSTTRLAALLAGALLAATGCTDADQVDEGPTPTVSGSPTGGATGVATEPSEPDDAAGSTPSARPGGEMPLAASCTIGGEQAPSIALAHPEDWLVGECGWFDPTLDELEEGTENTSVDVTWRIADAPFAEVAAAGEGRQEERRLPAVVDGREAVRVEATAQEGLYPTGTELTQWFVDLGSESPGGTGTLVGTVANVGEVAIDEAIDVLDAMARAATIGDEDDAAVVVARSEAGGEPFVVTFEDGCLRLRDPEGGDAPADEVCDLAPEGVATVRLGAPGVGASVVAGLAPVGTDVVGLGRGRAVATVRLPDDPRPAWALPAPDPEADPEDPEPEFTTFRGDPVTPGSS